MLSVILKFINVDFVVKKIQAVCSSSDKRSLTAPHLKGELR